MNKNYPVLRRIKILYSQLYKYAMQNDICEKGYSKYVDVSQYKNRNPNAYKREPFSEEEIALLWEISPRDIRASFTLMMIYSGCRIGELLNLKKKDICLEHLPHDTRHTCITMLTMAQISDKIIRKIVGHKGQNVTEIVYTHFEIKELQDAINQI